jgi:mannose-6-phosphate isomerase
MFVPYPLLMSPHLERKPWGGRERLRQTFPREAAREDASTGGGRASETGGTGDTGDGIGEAWVVASHNHAASRIANGRYSGLTLTDLLRDFPAEMTARPGDEPYRYPLLVKFIDAAEDLSVQVHPRDQDCLKLRLDDRGKTEAWLILGAPPDRRILYGLAPGTDEAGLRRALESGDIAASVAYRPIEPGDFLYVPAGVVHAILGGTFLCEIQQSSNTTFRLHDWNRKPARALHLERGIAVTDFDGAPEHESFRRLVGLEGDSVSHTMLTSNPYFEVVALQVAAGATVRVGEAGQSEVIVICAAGSGTMEGAGEDIPLGLGATIFLPATLESARVRATRELTLLLTRPFAE